MSRYCKLILVFAFLFAGIVLLFKKCEAVVRLRKIINEIRSKIVARDKQTGLEQRKQLYELERKKSFWITIEKELVYSGIKKSFHNISGAAFLVANAIVIMCCFLFCCGIGRPMIGILADTGWCFVVFMIIQIGKAANMRRVSEDLPKFLDFLGSYSITSGEIIGILSQISIYLNSPLKDVIEDCVAESRVSGNTGAALLAMADKIEHPQFKLLIRNIEMTARYSADFSTLVADSRRGLREYLGQCKARKGMLREAIINMILLLIMSGAVLMTVNSLIGGGIGDVVLNSFAGRLAMIGVTVIVGMFSVQAFSIEG